MGDVRGAGGECRLDVRARLPPGLTRKTIHQIDIEIADAGGLQRLQRLFDLGAAVDAADGAQQLRLKALHTERYTVDASLPVSLETVMLEGSGIGFQGDLGAGFDLQPGGDTLQQLFDRPRREQAGGAAAEVNGTDRASADQRQIPIQIPQQGFDIGRGRDRAPQRVRVEIAIGALADAPRQVHVKTQR